MRVLVTGGRNYLVADHVFAVLDELHAEIGISMLIEGGATGADACARTWAAAHEVPAETYPADWRVNGRAAGPLRNRRMLDEGQPDLVVAFPGGRGTASMVAIARAAGVAVTEIPRAKETP